MNGDRDLKEQFQLRLQKATRSLIVADKLVLDGDYDFASSRAYYGAFYAMEAIF
jgi:uncharacterized protein (UPF0332 family)